MPKDKITQIIRKWRYGTGTQIVDNFLVVVCTSIRRVVKYTYSNGLLKTHTNCQKFKIRRTQ